MLFAFAESQGLSRQRLFEISGLPEDALDDPDRLVSYEPLLCIWRELLAVRPGEPLGLRYASLVSIDALGVVGYALRHARDGQQVIALYERLSRLADPLLQFDVQICGEHHRVSLDHDPSVIAMVEPMEMFVIGMVRMANLLVRGEVRVTEVCFRHPRRHPIGLYREALGEVSVRFEAPFDGVVFPSEVLDLPLNESDPRVANYLLQHATSLMDSMAPITSPLDQQVRSAIDARLLAGEYEPKSVPRALGLSLRSLQRELRALGTTFSAELDRARQERAMLLLARPELTIAEIAFSLGYAESRAFHRSFRRWTGHSPSQVRRAK